MGSEMCIRDRIATEELTELLKPVVLCPSNIFRCDTRPAKPLDLCLVDLY